MRKILCLYTILMYCVLFIIGCDTECGSSRSSSSEGITSNPTTTVPSGDNTTDTGNQSSDQTDDVTADIVYHIIYNNTKNMSNITPQTFKASDTIVLPSISKDGWIFGGWSDSSTDGNVITGWSAGDHTSDVALWAVWTAKNYTVTLFNNGDVSGDTSLTATFDANLPSLTIVPSKTGYNFGGYWTAVDGQGTQYIDANGDGCKKWDLTSDTTLIAFFLEHGTHLITYNNLNGAAAPSKKTFKETEDVALENLTIDGYTFDGWFDAAEGGFKVEGWSAGVKTDNVTVYAHWTAEQYDITYKDEGENVEFSGTMTGEPTKHTYGTPTALPVPTKTGYEFGGWFVTSDCADNSVDTLGAESFTENITLYAKWNICEYDIVYKNVQGLNNTNVTSYTVLNNVSLSDLSAQGWMFDGWSEVVDDVTEDTKTVGWNAGRIGNVTLWANLARGYRCSASEMSSLLGSLSAENGPYLIRITDLAPDLSLIKTALQTRDVSVDLDLSRCSSLTEIPESALSDCSNIVGISFSENVTSIGKNAFGLKSNIAKVDYRGTIEDWCGISFGNIRSNPTFFAHNLYLNGELLTDLIIPDTVTEINDYAFTQCSNITNVQIHNSVTSIGVSAFNGCSGLTSIEIPNGVTSIGNNAFGDCTGLTEPVYNAYFFAKLPSSHNGSYTIPSGITSIAGSAFSGCSELTSIEIPDSVTSIGDGAFYDCSGLMSVTIPNSVNSIGARAFRRCGLTSVTIPNSVTSIGDSVFSLCGGLISVDMPDSVIGGEERWFENCISLTNITIPNGVTSIGVNTFYNCYALTNVTLPASVESIGSQAFWFCSNLATLTVKATTPPEGTGGLQSCCALTTIYVPTESVDAYKAADGWSDYADKIVAIGSGLPNMVSVSELSSYISTISDDETSEVIITDNNPDLSAIKTILQAYPQKKILLNLNLCLGLTEIQAGALDDCSCLVEMSYPSSLTSVLVPNTVNRIAEYAFYGKQNLISIEIPNSVTSIGYYVFYDCDVLTSVTIGNGVTSIGQYAFAYCSGMTTLTVKASTPPIFGNNMLFGCNALTTIYVPTGSVETYKATSGWSDYADKIVAIPTEP